MQQLVNKPTAVELQQPGIFRSVCYRLSHCASAMLLGDAWSQQMLIKLLSLPLSQEVLFSYVTFRQIYVFCMAINSCNNLQLVLAALVAATMIVAAAFALLP